MYIECDAIDNENIYKQLVENRGCLISLKVITNEEKMCILEVIPVNGRIGCGHINFENRPKIQFKNIESMIICRECEEQVDIEVYVQEEYNQGVGGCGMCLMYKGREMFSIGCGLTDVDDQVQAGQQALGFALEKIELWNLEKYVNKIVIFTDNLDVVQKNWVQLQQRLIDLRIAESDECVAGNIAKAQCKRMYKLKCAQEPIRGVAKLFTALEDIVDTMKKEEDYKESEVCQTLIEDLENVIDKHKDKVLEESKKLEKLRNKYGDVVTPRLVKDILEEWNKE